MDGLTPDDVRDVVFDHAPVLRRGYDEVQVDEFLDRVEQSLVDLRRTVREQQQEINRAAERPGGPPTGPDHRAVADQIISDARRRADQIVDGARQAAGRVVEEARAEAFRMVADASRQIARAGVTGQDPELAAASVETANRMAQIRDALAAEVSNLYAIVDRMHDGAR